MFAPGLFECLRRLLTGVQESDRNSLSKEIERWARAQLRNDPRCCFSKSEDPAGDVGSDVATALLQIVHDASGAKQVPHLHAELLYRTAHLGAPRLRSKLRKKASLRRLAASRRFLLGLDEVALCAALYSGVRTLVQQRAYRELPEKQWHHTKANLRTLVGTCPELTLVRWGKRSYVAHSKFFRGAPRVEADEVGRLRGRVLDSHEVERWMAQSSIDRRQFAKELAVWTDEAEPVYLPLDVLATHRFLLLRSLASHEGHGGLLQSSTRMPFWGERPLACTLEDIAERIRVEVRAALDRHRPRHVRKTAERLLLWEAASIHRLEGRFEVHCLDPDPHPHWKQVLEGGLDELGIRRGRKAHYRVVDHVDRAVAKVLRDWLSQSL